jgi:NAD(P)-dependent dehydrogenase (short-subunit alcohol dehydrogenase family)
MSLTRSISFHYGVRGIRCNAVCPGPVETAISVGNGVPSKAGLGRVLPFLQASAPSRVAAPGELAAAIAFLASKDASYINGAILPVDGGWFAA